MCHLGVPSTMRDNVDDRRSTESDGNAASSRQPNAGPFQLKGMKEYVFTFVPDVGFAAVGLSGLACSCDPSIARRRKRHSLQALKFRSEGVKAKQIAILLNKSDWLTPH